MDNVKDLIVLKRKFREMVKKDVANGRGRVAAIRRMFEEVRKDPKCDPAVWFPAFVNIIEKSNHQSINQIAKIVGDKFRYKDVVQSLSKLLIIHQFVDHYGRAQWVASNRAAAYMPEYSAKSTRLFFYPFAALMVEAHLRGGSSKAWDVVECGFGFKDQAWFEKESVAYKSIINEFGAAALPGCFI